MSGRVRRTVAREVARAGAGLHTGVDTTLTLRPAPFGAGVRFVVPGGTIPATAAHAEATPGATVLRCDGARVSTPEHLLAALAALGVTDVTVALDGPEVPALDGAASAWVDALDEAGRVDGPALTPVHLRHRVEVIAFGGTFTAVPGDPALAVEVAFDDGPVGAFAVLRAEETFREHVAWARTFVLARDVEVLRASGRGRGATAANTAVWPDGPLRSADEPVRHKLLDLWGDLALAGPVDADVHVVRGSHRLHLAGVAALLAAAYPAPPPIAPPLSSGS